MSQEYVLTRDIVYDHNERMHNIKKYYPYFKLIEGTFTQYKEGKYQRLDMGYIMMAVLRFFIEENNFKDKDVTYQEFYDFVLEVLNRDFELDESEEEEKELIGYIFDKLKNDGKPFSYEYFDPEAKEKKVIRIKIIEDKLVGDNVLYSITSDAIEFYLDTKEIKDESTITTSQLLLSKLIASKNFRGGTEVVKRINSEVQRLISRKNEVLSLLSVDVFEGIKAFEDFKNTGIKWFEEEQKLFAKNRELIEKTLRQGETEGKYHDAMEDIYVLESQLNKAMRRHSELLMACTELQVKADEIVEASKYLSLRTTFNFGDAISRAMEKDDASVLSYMITPLMKINPVRLWSIKSIDDMLNLKSAKDEEGEKVMEESNQEEYVFADEIEADRIAANYYIFLDVLFDMLSNIGKFTARDYLKELSVRCKCDMSSNGDYYSFMVHMCQKDRYDMKTVLEKPDTFIEENIKAYIEEHDKLGDFIFSLVRKGNDETLSFKEYGEMSDVIFVAGGEDDE